MKLNIALIKAVILVSGSGFFMKTLERFSIAFTANGKRQAEIFSLMKNNEAFLI